MRRLVVCLAVLSLLLFGVSTLAVAGGPNDGVGLGEGPTGEPPHGPPEIPDHDDFDVPPPEEDEPGLHMLAPCDHRGCVKWD